MPATIGEIIAICRHFWNSGGCASGRNDAPRPFAGGFLVKPSSKSRIAKRATWRCAVLLAGVAGTVPATAQSTTLEQMQQRIKSQQRMKQQQIQSLEDWIP